MQIKKWVIARKYKYYFDEYYEYINTFCIWGKGISSALMFPTEHAAKEFYASKHVISGKIIQVTIEHEDI